MVLSKRRRRPTIQAKSEAELDKMRSAGRLAAECLAWILEQIEPGMTTEAIDALQTEFAARHGARPAPLGYKGFPKSICTSINEVICHGIPSPDRALIEGDIVGIDVTLIVDGYHGDNAATVGVGQVSDEARRLMRCALRSLKEGLAQVRAGAHLGDIGHAIQAVAERGCGFSVVREFVGHGIGASFHEEPQVSHIGKRRTGLRMRPGMTFTVEPMINAGGWRSRLLADGWTAVTADGSLSAQYEHTIAVTERGYEVLTALDAGGAWEPPGRAEIGGALA